MLKSKLWIARIQLTTKLSGATYSRGKPNRYCTKHRIAFKLSELAQNRCLTAPISASTPSPFHWVWRPLQRFVQRLSCGDCGYRKQRRERNPPQLKIRFLSEPRLVFRLQRFVSPPHPQNGTLRLQCYYTFDFVSTDSGNL